MKKELAHYLEEFLNDRIPRYGIKIRRGDTHSIATHFVDYWLSLTLPSVSDIKENLKLKMLHCLWNLALDDHIDNGSDAQYLLGDTTDVLSSLFLGKKVQPRTSVGKLMNELVESILSMNLCNIDMGRTFFFLDALDQVKGFTYEQIIYKRRDMATLLEYEEHTAATNLNSVWGVD